MTLIYLIKNSFVAVILGAVILFGFSNFTFAQNTVSLSVSPTLFDMSAEPGQTWQSALRVINTNPFALELEAEVVNFSPRDEGGAGEFLPLLDDEVSSDTLASWITVNKKAFTVPAEQTATIPLLVSIPEDATPGGHFAAILIGTRGVGEGDDVSKVETSQKVSALFFLRVDGNIVESASVRSFRAVDTILSEPQATFELRVQNDGNVHVQPLGDIYIYNMWGQQRGQIPVNKKSLFGKVLPDSVRKYSFGWTGEWSITDIGKYTAETSLTYGERGKQSLYAKTHFWVIPWKPVMIVLGVLALVFYLVLWGIRSYVRRMLVLAGVDPATIKVSTSTQKRVPLTKNRPRLSLTAPLQSGLLDLRSHLKSTTTWFEKFTALWSLVRHHRGPVFGILLLVVGLSLIIWFVTGARTAERDYEVTLGTDKNAVTLTSDELQSELPPLTGTSNGIQVSVVNRSGVVGLGAQEAAILTAEGYVVNNIRADENADDERTVIVYDPALASDALMLSELLDGALLSAFTMGDDISEPIMIYIGSDRQK